MTRVQALEHRYPDKLPLPGQDTKIEFEYIRHGTTSLIGFFEVATGKIFLPYLNETRKEADFCEAGKNSCMTHPTGFGLYIHQNTAPGCQIEIWFGIINRKLLKRQSYTSVDEL